MNKFILKEKIIWRSNFFYFNSEFVYECCTLLHKIVCLRFYPVIHQDCWIPILKKESGRWHERFHLKILTSKERRSAQLARRLPSETNVCLGARVRFPVGPNYSVALSKKDVFRIFRRRRFETIRSRIVFEVLDTTCDRLVSWLR